MDKIQEALNQAYAGEAKAALRLKVYAQKAEDEGYKQMARLFRVISFSEEIHGARALRVLREIKGTEENLAASFESEKKVAEVAYDQFVKLAEEAGNKEACCISARAGMWKRLMPNFINRPCRTLWKKEKRLTMSVKFAGMSPMVFCLMNVPFAARRKNNLCF